MIAPTIALSNDFLDAFARLPRPQQRKVREFTQKFRDNPTSSAINFEKIHAVRDDKVRTVRIDQKYRAVILQPREGNVYILVWVDNHDEAMDWARKKVFEINPATGALQVVNVSEVDSSVRAANAPSDKQKGLFDRFDDATLVSFGVPEALTPAVRAARSTDALTALSRHLPAEATEALTWLAEGIPVEEVRAAVGQSVKKTQVDTGDFVTALENPDSRRRFVKIASDDQLDVILDAPMEKWRIFLHPTQEELVRMRFNGPARVLGGAGTGKTVVAMHRVRHLVKDVFTGNQDRVLFTTFTANLATDIEQNLGRLCGPEVSRIEVTHLHAWAARYLRQAGVGFKVATEDDLRACWDAAVRPDSEPWRTGFLMQEWTQVVQAQGILTQAEYFAAPRTGRGQTLTRQQRAQVWSAFVRFNAEMASRGLKEWTGVIREAREQLTRGRTPPYKAVVVDEAQDFHPEEWRLIRALAATGTNDLFIVGDAHQRIYGPRVTLSRCGISVVGRSRKLRVNYRTTEQIRAWAVAVLEGGGTDDLDGGADDHTGYKSLLTGPAPQVEHFQTADQERRFLEKALGDLASKHGAENVCVVARTSKSLKDYVTVLDKLMLPCTVLDKASAEAARGVRLATMHRVKGLEFPCMVLVGVNATAVPLQVGSADQDPVLRAEQEARERSLLYVAATRARDKLLVTSWGKPSRFLGRLVAGGMK